MKTYRITFRSEIFVEAESAEEAIDSFESMCLYNEDAMAENDLGFCEIVSIEDENGCDCM